jgi:hypothetical protein
VVGWHIGQHVQFDIINFFNQLLQFGREVCPEHPGQRQSGLQDTDKVIDSIINAADFFGLGIDVFSDIVDEDLFTIENQYTLVSVTLLQIDSQVIGPLDLDFAHRPELNL